MLGRSGLQITRVVFGAWAIGGGGWEFGWGRQEDAASEAAIQRALEHGVNWIDTAAAYGFGHSEEVVGRALAGMGEGERPHVFTKCSLLEGPGRRVIHSLKRDSVLREAEASLRRLRIEVEAQLVGVGFQTFDDCPRLPADGYHVPLTLGKIRQFGRDEI